MNIVRATAFIILALFVSHAYAWNGLGHMTVAAIAYDQLDPATRKEVGKLLKLNPAYSSWVKGAPAKDRSKVAFMMAATWPDYIKHASGYANDGEIPKGADAARNIGYADKFQHRYWHYIDIPFWPDHTPVMQPVSPNAQTQIAAFRDGLKSASSSDDIKSYDLVWLIHLVGDVHQPLHATSRFDKDQPNGDRGGNLVALCTLPCKDELHAFWDDILGKESLPSDAIARAAEIQPVSGAQAANRDELVWINESFEAAKNAVYVAPVGVGAGPYMLDDAYISAATSLAKKRIALAGARLANLLNDALK